MEVLDSEGNRTKYAGVDKITGWQYLSGYWFSHVFIDEGVAEEVRHYLKQLERHP